MHFSRALINPQHQHIINILLSLTLSWGIEAQRSTCPRKLKATVPSSLGSKLMFSTTRPMVSTVVMTPLELPNDPLQESHVR